MNCRIYAVSHVQVDDKMWYIDFSFLGCLAAYIGLLGFMTIVIAIFLKYLGVFDVDERANAEAGMVNATSTEAAIAIETLPLVNGKEMPRLYGASDQEDEPGSSFNIKSSDNLNGGKMCVVCYDDCRNCFFAPCGHFTTCFTCAQRIAGGSNNLCPICRGSIKTITKLIKA